MINLEKGIRKHVPLSDIVVSDIKYRPIYDTLDECKQLCDSIAKDGIQQDLLVRPYFDKEKKQEHPTKLELVDGGHRFYCAQQLNLANVPIKIVNLTDDEVLRLQMVLNERRLKTKPIDMLNQVNTYIGRHPEYPLSRVAEELGLWPTQLHDILKLKNLSKEATKLVEENKISACNAYALGKFIPSEYQIDDWPEDGIESILVKAQQLEGVPFADFCSKLRKALNKGGKVAKEDIGPAIKILTTNQIKNKLEEAKAEINGHTPGTEEYVRLLGRYQMIQEVCGVDEMSIAERRAIKSAEDNTKKLKIQEKKVKLAEESARKAKEELKKQKERLQETEPVLAGV